MWTAPGGAAAADEAGSGVDVGRSVGPPHAIKSSSERQ